MKRPTEAGPSSRTESRVTRVAIGVLVLLLVALQVRLWTGKASWAEVSELRERLEARKVEITRLERENAALEAEVRVLKAGPESMEARARGELGMIRSGETFFLVVPEADGGRPAAARED